MVPIVTVLSLSGKHWQQRLSRWRRATVSNSGHHTPKSEKKFIEYEISCTANWCVHLKCSLFLSIFCKLYIFFLDSERVLNIIIFFFCDVLTTFLPEQNDKRAFLANCFYYPWRFHNSWKKPRQFIHAITVSDIFYCWFFLL